jgi:hypothetical protein
MRHHEFSRIQLQNIHDRANLVALCSVCHYAFDCGEWMFIPEEVITWTEKIKETPQVIQKYNSLRSIVFRRLLLVPDPESKAFQDNHYKSAFDDRPTKIWPGEPGVVIVRPPPDLPATPTAELQEILDNFGALKKLWLAYKSPCSIEKCPICQRNKDGTQGKEGNMDDMNGKDNEDDGDEDDGEEDEDDSEEDGDDVEEDEDDNEMDEEEGDEKEYNQEDDLSEEDGKQNEQGDETTDGSKNVRKRIFTRQTNSTGTKKLIQANKRHQKPRNKGRDWMTSTPYDESIPYSHRYGYTWAGSTSNELMQLWQSYRKPAVD